MIVELRIYTMKPGTLPLAEERFVESITQSARTKLSPMAALWHTEAGPLNRLVQLWPYESFEDRERVRKESTRIKGWGPDIGDFMIAQESTLLTPAPFSPPLAPRRLGNLYEMRTATFLPR